MNIVSMFLIQLKALAEREIIVASELQATGEYEHNAPLIAAAEYARDAALTSLSPIAKAEALQATADDTSIEALARIGAS